MAKQKNRDASNERKRKLISINKQIDKIQDVYFKSYTQNIDKRISSLAERQSHMLSQLYDTMEKEERDRIKQSFNDRQDALKKSLDDWKIYNQQVRSDLTLADKFAADVFYWNRRRNLRDLEREARYRFDDIRDEAEELAEDMNDSFSSVADTLRDWATALNVNELASGMEDTQKSMREVRVDMQKYVSLSNEEWQTFRTQANEFSKSTDYAIANVEYLEKMSEILAVYDDKDFASKMAGSVTKVGYLGLDVSSLEGLFEVANGDTDYTNETLSQMMRIQTTDNLHTNMDDLASLIQDNRAVIQSITSDTDKQRDMLQQLMSVETAANANYLTGVTDKLIDILNTPMSEMSDDIHLLGGTQIQQLMSSGHIEEAAELFVNNLSNQLTQFGDNYQAKLEYLNALGFDDKELEARIKNGDNVLGFFDSMNEVSSILVEERNAATKFIDNWNNTGATALDKFNNKFQTTKLGSWLDDISNELDLTLSEVMLIGSGGMSILKSIKDLRNSSGSNGGLLSRLFGSRGAGGAGSAASGGTGILSRLLGSATAGTGLSGGLANTAINLGAGNLAGGASMSATGLAVTGGASIAGGVLGGASIISGIADLVTANTQETWQDKADQVTEGALKLGGTAAAAGVGAAIGSIVPGIGTAVGGLVGAGVGGLATLIWGDNWAEQITDTIDGTKSIKNSIDELNSASASLTQTLSKTQTVEDLIDNYNSLKLSLESAQVGTEYYQTQQDKLNSVISELRTLYPELFNGEGSLSTLTSDVIKSSDDSIEAIQAMIDKENELAWTRLYNASSDLNIDDAKSQFEKSYETYSTQADAQNYLKTAYLDISEWLASGYLKEGANYGSYEVTDLGKEAGIQSSYDEYVANVKDKWYDSGYNTTTGDGIYNLLTNSEVMQAFKSNMDNSWDTTHGNGASTDLAAKEDQLVSEMKALMGDQTIDSVLDLASNYANLTVVQQGYLKNLAKAYDEFSSIKGFNMPTDILPTTEQLESAAGVDLNGSDNVGHYAIGLDRVPYDNFPAFLHKDEAVLTAEEAEVWRQATSEWAPNDKSSALSSGDTNIINQHVEVVEDDDDDSTLSEVIDTLKWLTKEIKKSIQDNSGVDVNARNVSYLQTYQAQRPSFTDTVFSFV